MTRDATADPICSHLLLWDLSLCWLSPVLTFGIHFQRLAVQGLSECDILQPVIFTQRFRQRRYNTTLTERSSICGV